MQTIHLLSTGGTVEKIYSEQTGQVENMGTKIERYLRLEQDTSDYKATEQPAALSLESGANASLDANSGSAGATARIASVATDLSAQERRVLTLVAEGRTNKEIAVAMKLSPKTVKNYLSRVFQKLQVAGRAEAVARLLRGKHG